MGPETRVVHAIRAALELRGCIVLKLHGNRYMPSGVPDLLIARPDGCTVWLEVKQPGRTDGPQGDGLSALQHRWLAKLGALGVPCGHAESVAEALEVCGFR